jgi:hypothetical protein
MKISSSINILVCVLAGLMISGRELLAADHSAQNAGAALAERSVPLPSPNEVRADGSLRCRALMESELTGSYDSTLTQGLDGKLSSGANNVSISMGESKTLSFLSEAGFSTGVARGPEFQIIANTSNELVASFFDGSSINTLVLNKSNGLAVWSKIRATFPGYNAPTGSQSYLACQ